MKQKQKISNIVFERIWKLAKIEFKLRYYENKLGLFWALLKPSTQLFIYYIAFNVLFKTGIENFALYTFTGLILWEFFVEGSLGLIAILQTKKYLYEYSNMSKVEIYLASIVSISLGFLFNCVILMFFIYLSNTTVGWNILYLPLIFLNLFIFTFGLSMILSNVYVLVKDIQQIWVLINQAFMWVSPIFFSDLLIKEKIGNIEFFNPLFGILVNFRNILLFNKAPDFYLLLLNMGHAILIIIIGLVMLRQIGKKAAELI